jgi:hypothetical protein
MSIDVVLTQVDAGIVSTAERVAKLDAATTRERGFEAELAAEFLVA